MKMLAVFALSMVAALAQAATDYSGTWRLDRNASGLPSGPDVTWVVRHAGDLMVLEVMTNGSLAATLEKRVDGSPFEENSRDGSRTVMRGAWRGADLVFSGTKTSANGTTTDVTETWQRLGETLAVTTIVKGAGTEYRSLKILRKVR